MNMKTTILASLLALTLTGCSALNSATVSEEKLMPAQLKSAIVQTKAYKLTLPQL